MKKTKTKRVRGRQSKRKPKKKKTLATKLKHVVFGTPTHDDCPLCIEAAGGRPVGTTDPARRNAGTNPNAEWFVFDDDGAELYPGATRVSFVEVTVRGDSTVWPLLPAEPRPEKVPSGTTIERYLDLLTLFAPSLLDAGPVIALIDGAHRSPTHELRDGDAVTVTREVTDQLRHRC